MCEFLLFKEMIIKSLSLFFFQCISSSVFFFFTSLSLLVFFSPPSPSAFFCLGSGGLKTKIMPYLEQ